MTGKIYHTGWSTKNEMDHLDGLLTGKWTGIPPENPDKLLRSYIRGVKNRILYHTWESVDGEEVLQYATKLKNGNNDGNDDVHDLFAVWWKKEGYRFKPETDDEKDWINVVRYWAWKAWEARNNAKP